MKMKDKAFFTVAQIAVLITGLTVVFLTTGCKVRVNEFKLTGKPTTESAVLVNTSAGNGGVGGSVYIYEVDGRMKDSEGKSFGSGVVAVIYLEPGEHTLGVFWEDTNSSTDFKDIDVTLPKGSITEIGFEKDGNNIFYLFHPLNKEQLNEVLSFDGGNVSLLNDFKRKRSHLWKREQ
jgi:hypothetical protein